MSCPTPILRKMKDGSVVPTRCGYCPVCRVDIRNEWTWRIKAEIGSGDAVFVTLTIDDDHLIGVPKLYGSQQMGPTLKVETVKRFFKRFRKCTGLTSKDFKYYICGEYGELDGRPHYHSIITGVSAGKPLSYDLGIQPLIKKCWPFGFISVEPASIGSIRYVLKYIDKMLSPKAWDLQYPDLLRPFHTCSKGFGLDWMIKNRDYLKENDGKFFFDGKWRPLPRYYKEKLGLSIPNRENYSDVSIYATLRRNPNKMAKVSEYMNVHDCGLSDALYALGKQTVVNFLAHENVDNKYLS